MMELYFWGPGQVHVRLGVAPGEHREGVAGGVAREVRREREDQENGGLLQHNKSLKHGM